jgi:uncharacterized membrane protein YoaK (UPF0700 family)
LFESRLAALIPAPASAVLLCLIAGYIDAIGYTDYDHVFAANMTGNTVLLSISLAQADWPLAATRALTLASFLLGALAAEFIKRAGFRPTLPLLLSGAPLVLVYSVQPDANWTLAALSFGMGLQGASVARFANINVQTVVITGTLLKLAEASVHRLVSGQDAAQPASPPHALSLFWLTWLSYAVGAVLSLAAHGLGPLKFLFPLIPLIPAALSEGQRD